MSKSRDELVKFVCSSIRGSASSKQVINDNGLRVVDEVVKEIVKSKFLVGLLRPQLKEFSPTINSDPKVNSFLNGIAEKIIILAVEEVIMED